MPKPKRGKMKDIRVNEVSMVDKPANKLPFLFFKREGEQNVNLNKKTKIKIEIESDGTGKGTKITVNGDKLGEVRDFSFYFYGNDAQSPVSCSYSKVVEAEDGFKRTETYYLSKGEIVMSKEMLKALQKYFDTEDIDFEKKVDEEEIQKTIELITKEYKESFPEDLEKAVGILAKCASGGYQVKEKEELEKAGAKFSKDVIKKVQAVIAAVEALKAMMPDLKGTTQKAGDGESEEMAALTKQLEELKKVIADSGLEKKDEDKSEITKLTEVVEKVAERVKTMEKGGAVKKSIDDQENEDDEPKGAGEKGEQLWPTLTSQKKD